MIEAGVLPCFWSYAAPCFCINYNIRKGMIGSPWNELWHSSFPGTACPCGCLVMFKDSTDRRNTPNRNWDPKGLMGVFAGYKLHPGYSWKDEYLVWELESFRSSDLRTTSTSWHQNVGTPHVTKVCLSPPEGIFLKKGLSDGQFRIVRSAHH